MTESVQGTFRWLGFGCSSALTKTVVHFFPSSGSVSAPYPATVKLTTFSPEWGEKRVVLEGARLSQPDGVRLEDAFTFLSEPRPGWFGVIVEVSTLEARVELSASQCIIELAGKGRSLRYFPKALNSHFEGKEHEALEIAPKLGIMLKEASLTSSLIFVNAESAIFEPKIEVNSQFHSIPGVAPISAIELGGDDKLSEHSGFNLNQVTETTELNVQNVAFGTIRQQLIKMSEAGEQRNVGGFILYRETLSRRPVAAVQL